MMTPINRLSYLASVIAVGLLVLVPAQLSAVELNRFFSNGMVLQRDKALKIWGTAKKGDTVTVKFAGQTAKATADKDGRWIATLKPAKASAAPQTLEVKSSGKTIALKNIVVGDVFLFARQSSIDVSLGSKPEGKKAAAAVAVNKNFRFIRITVSPAKAPLDNLKKDATKGWKTASKESALTMSAAAFHLGRDLAKDVKVPLGIVDLDMGYHFPGAWLSKKGLEQALKIPGTGAHALKLECDYLAKDIAAWDAGKSDYVRDYASPKHPPKKYEGPLRGASPIERPYAPAVCYNSVIHPLQGIALKGMLLQLGNDYPWALFNRLRRLGKMEDRNEVRTAAGQGYQIFKAAKQMTPQVLPVAVSDLRSSLGDESLPVAWIMPTGSDRFDYATQNQDVRELQRRTQSKNKAIDLILPGAKNVRMSGQPADEALLAGRCKQWVMGTFYGAKSPASGPLFDRVEYAANAATIHFKAGTATGLTAKDGALKHFEVAGEDGVFSPCVASIDGSTIKLKSETVAKPTSVRFGWNRRPIQSLVNSAGLPALPFNTDAKWAYNYFPPIGPVDKAEEEGTGPDIASVVAKRHGNPKGFENPVTLFADASLTKHGAGPAKYPKDQWHQWRLLAVEVADHAPEGWKKPDFNDSKWDKVILPIAWPRGHVGLLRTTFEVKDVNAIESLLFRAKAYKVRHFRVYLNGKLVARADVEGRALGAVVPLTPYAKKLLKNGKNSLAVITDHGRRHVGFSLVLQGKPKGG